MLHIVMGFTVMYDWDLEQLVLRMKSLCDTLDR